MQWFCIGIDAAGSEIVSGCFLQFMPFNLSVPFNQKVSYCAASCPDCWCGAAGKNQWGELKG
jgi:hypothetical protein